MLMPCVFLQKTGEGPGALQYLLLSCCVLSECAPAVGILKSIFIVFIYIFRAGRYTAVGLLKAQLKNAADYVRACGERHVLPSDTYTVVTTDPLHFSTQ